jgi:hypothetical protein
MQTALYRAKVIRAQVALLGALPIMRWANGPTLPPHQLPAPSPSHSPGLTPNPEVGHTRRRNPNFGKTANFRILGF